MAVSYSMKGIVGYKSPDKKLKEMKNFGFDRMVLDMGILFSPYELEHWGEESKATDDEKENKDVSNVFSALEKYEVMCTAVKAPILLPVTKRTDLNEVILDLAKKSMDVAKRMKVPYVIVQPLFSGLTVREEWEVNRGYFLELAEYAADADLKILFCNQYKDFRGRKVRGIGCDAWENVRWIEELNRELGEERFGFCLDIGVCTLLGMDMQSMIQTMGSKLKAVIIRDCDGIHDSALFPFSCAQNGQWTTDWMGLVRGLRAIDYEGQLIVDMCHSLGRMSPRVRNSFLQYAKEVVFFLEWQIHMEKEIKKYPKIVLFGAGQMCSNFMEYYGKQYKPLFTCDNNSKLWGTEVSGLEVRNPEALKEIPSDCGVLICNTYYKEIAKQLQEMGISRVAYYNDEYPPVCEENEDV